MQEEIDVGGYDLAKTMAKERRRQAEAAQALGLNVIEAKLLPLSIALARLTARLDVEEAA